MLRVLLDPGHAANKAGSFNHRYSADEHSLNVIQAEACANVLSQKNIESEIFDPATDDLLAIGKRAKNFDAFVSLHLNSCRDEEINYTSVCLHEIKASQASKDLARCVVRELLSTLRLEPYRGSFGVGLMYLPLQVLKQAQEASKAPCILTEAFFLSYRGFRDLKDLEWQAGKAGQAVGRAIAEYLKKRTF